MTVVSEKVDVDTTAKEPLITDEQVWDVISFARNMAPYGGMYLNPELVNARMRDITLNPLQATTDSLAEAMKEPKSHEKELQGFSQSFETMSMVYKRLLSYLGNMLSFDLTYTSNTKPSDYKTPRYEKDLDAVEEFLEKFDYKRELGVAVREMLRNDAFFACFRDTGKNYTLQELPSEYCKITGRWAGGFLFSFNMYFFLQPGVDIDMYPPFFKQKYKEIWGSSNTTGRYDPSLSGELRGRSSWIYWVDVPTTIGVCFKLTPELATRLPYFTPLFNDLILQSLMRNLQKNINMASASKMIMGQVPMLNRDAKATVKDSIAVSPELLGRFLALVRNALSESVNMASAPLDDIQAIEFKGDNELYDKYLRTSLASSGINTNLIFSSNIKPNAVETQLSLNVDEQMMLALYPYFNTFMGEFANRFTKRFKFSFAFEGTEFFLNRKERLDTAMSLLDKGIVLPQKISAAIGMRYPDFKRQMEESAALGFVSLLTPPAFEQQKEMAKINGTVMKNNKSDAESSAPGGDAKKKGRPLKDASELGEEGMNTRESAGNVGRGGKV